MIGGVNDRDPLAIENADAIELVLERVRLAPWYRAELLDCVRWGGPWGATASRPSGSLLCKARN